MSAALDRLNASLTTLNATADNVVGALGTSDEVAISAAADTVDSINTKLTSALNPTATTTT